MYRYFLSCGFYILPLLFFVNGLQGQNTVVVSQSNAAIEIHNGQVKALFLKQNKTIRQEYYAKREGKWVLVAASFHRPENFPAEAPQLFNSQLDPAHRFLTADVVQEFSVVNRNPESVTVKLSGTVQHTPIAQYITLQKGQSYCHIAVEAELTGRPAKLDYLLSVFTFNVDKAPSFVHTPGLKFDNEDSRQNRFTLLPARDQIIGDRAFHAPAVILQENNLFTALVPDLNAINKYAVLSPDARRTTDIPRNIYSVAIEPSKYTLPTGLDLNVKTGLTRQPVFTYGFMDNIIAHHIRYQRKNDSSMIRTLLSNQLRYEFDLFISATAKENSGFQQVTAHQWKNYGHPVFMHQGHLTMPFEEYFRIVDSVTFRPSPYPDIDIPLKGYEDHGSWLQFELEGTPVGGYRSAINWWNDVIHNSTFWNNARDASGFWFWGKQLNKPDLMDKAKRIINFCLLAPRNEQGLFATLYNANTKQWGLQFSDPPHGKNQFFLRESDSYDVPSMSKTGAHLLDYYQRCEKDDRILSYLKPYADWLTTAIDDRGAVPSYVTKAMEYSPLLMHSAQPAASMWFLAAYYNATGQDRYRVAAKKIALFLEKEILPEAKWVDMEQYYSCGAKPLAFERDILQNQIVRGNLATIWACEGFAQLYLATQDPKYLQEGEVCIDYLSFSQCSWNPHFIYTAFPFGGFAADNADNAAMLDARQAETVKSFIWYGKMMGRQDLLERGIAAARSSVVLMNLPSHRANQIYAYTNIYPYGLGPENIDHEAHPQSAMRTSPSWGEGSGVFTGLAEAARELGGAYIDFTKNIRAGVNGVNISKAEQKGDKLYLTLTCTLSHLKMPWSNPYPISVLTRGLALRTYELYINGQQPVKVDLAKQNYINLMVLPDGKFAIR